MPEQLLAPSVGFVLLCPGFQRPNPPGESNPRESWNSLGWKGPSGIIDPTLSPCTGTPKPHPGPHCPSAPGALGALGTGPTPRAPAWAGFAPHIPSQLTLFSREQNHSAFQWNLVLKQLQSHFTPSSGRLPRGRILPRTGAAIFFFPKNFQSKSPICARASFPAHRPPTRP